MTEQLKGKYVLERCIGSGGMAEVFVARTVGAAGFSRQVAIKRIHRGLSSQAQFRQMFEVEARLGSSLRHSNVVSVLDFDEDDAGCLFLVMEYVDGIDLAGLLETGLLPLPVVLFVAGEILRGLAYVHDLPLVEGSPLGLVHRDVSPQNVLLSWDGAVQVSDFGIAKARMATQAGASILIKGKPAYMSPEQARGLSLDGRSDIFAAGVMLWEMLCGEALFHNPDDLGATLAAVMFVDAPPPSARSRRPVPPDLERATMGMLRRDREERHDAAAALAAVTACADYPRSGREALAALLPERLPARAPHRGPPRAPRPRPPVAPPAPRHAADAGSPATVTAPAIAAPVSPHRPGHIRAHGSMLKRAHRHPVRAALLGAVAIGALVGAMLHVAIGGNSSGAPGAPVPAAPSQPDPIERARPAEVPRAEAPGRAPGSSAARRGDANPTVRARVSAPVRPPAGGGMRVIDLRPEEPEPDLTGRVRRGSREIDLGPASD
jgi:serine/threonine protein kinase, bacterial